VFFRDGKFNLTSHEGMGLLVHELVHVAQNEKMRDSPIDTQQYVNLENTALANESLALANFYQSSNQVFSNDGLPHDEFSHDYSTETNLTPLESNSMLEFSGNFVIPTNNESTPTPNNMSFAGSFSQSSSSLSRAAEIPFTAEENRNVSAANSLAETSSAPSQVLDVEDIADQVYEIIADKIKRERERKGYR
jgi:hypothetical protein